MKHLGYTCEECGRNYFSTRQKHNCNGVFQNLGKWRETRKGEDQITYSATRDPGKLIHIKEIKEDLSVLAVKADKDLKTYIQDELKSIVKRARKRGELNS